MSDSQKKTAQTVPPPPKYRQNKVQTTNVPAPGNAVPQRGNEDQPKVSPARSSGFTAVQEMQRAILEFAAAASANDVTSLQGNEKGQMYGEQSRVGPQDMPVSRNLDAPEDNRKEYLGGSDPFGNFLTQQYIGKSDAGRQYLNVDVAGNKNRQDHSMEDLSFRGVIDSIKRIGSPGMGEKAVDGVWQVRTNNALKNIYAIADGLINFARDMTLTIPGYSEKDLANFSALIPKEYTDLKSEGEKAQRAKDLTTHIKAITKYFESFKTSVLNNKRMRAFIDQRKSFIQHPTAKEKSAKDVLGPEEHDFFKKNQTESVPRVSFKGAKGETVYIGLRELENMEAFKGFVGKLGRNPEDMNDVKKTLQEVESFMKNDTGY